MGRAVLIIHTSLVVCALAALLAFAGCSGMGASPHSASIVSFNASSSSIAPGTPVTLSWQTQNAASASISPGPSGLPANGSITVSPSSTTTYTLTVQGSNGGTASVTLTVQVSTSAPTVQVSLSPTQINAGSLSTISWTTTNATSITFNPVVNPTGEPGPLPLSGSATVSPSSTTTYVATVQGPGGTVTGSATLTVTQVAPTIQFAANPNNICCGQSSTLSWTTSNATSFSIDNGIGNQPTMGSVNVSPASTTTYTATATGPGGTTTATATVTVAAAGQLAVSLNANPLTVSTGQSSTLTWASQNATSVNVTDQNGNAIGSGLSGSATVSPSSTTSYTATATGATGSTATSAVSVQVLSTGDLTKIKHIIFFLQENRSFDMYFGLLGQYRASLGFGSPGDIDSFNPNVTLTGLQGIPRNPFHERTVLTDNLTPSWNESHYDLDRTIQYTDANGNCPSTPPPTCATTSCKMDRFMLTTNSITTPGLSSRDPNGDRAVGYYDQTDLPFYYNLAAQFATSDRWFSPLLSQTIPNRMYMFAGTSFGHILNQDPPPSTGWPQPTIFDALDNAGISWRYYYMDSSVFLAQWNTWYKNGGADQSKVVNINNSTSGWYQVLSQSNADAALPQVIFIERGSQTGLDEHPDNNIQTGAANTANIINALIKSPAWQDSVFILSFDEGGGLYDHVPPFSEAEPDNIQPMLAEAQQTSGFKYICGQFNESGFRVPTIVVSPWVRPHFVSHVYRDNTAILKFIETWAGANGFNLPALTARDAAQDDMTEFFDFSAPHMLNPTPLPAQPTNGTADWNLESAP